MYRTEQYYGMSKVSRRTVDTGTSLVADGMNSKTLQFWPTQEDHSRPVTQPLGTHSRQASTGSSAGQPVCLWQTNEDDDDPQYQYQITLILRGVPPLGGVKQGGMWKQAILKLNASISRKLEIRRKLVLMTNRKLHMRFRSTPKSMTLDDLELYKFEFSENFAGFRSFGRQQQLNE